MSKQKPKSLFGDESWLEIDSNMHEFSSSSDDDVVTIGKERDKQKKQEKQEKQEKEDDNGKVKESLSSTRRSSGRIANRLEGGKEANQAPKKQVKQGTKNEVKKEVENEVKKEVRKDIKKEGKKESSKVVAVKKEVAKLARKDKVSKKKERHGAGETLKRERRDKGRGGDREREDEREPKRAKVKNEPGKKSKAPPTKEEDIDVDPLFPSARASRANPGAGASAGRLEYQVTPMDAMMKLAKEPLMATLTGTGQKAARKGKKPITLGYVEGCTFFTNTTLMDYIATLCGAHEVSLRALVLKVQERGVSQFVPPSTTEWKAVLKRIGAKDKLPFIDSLLLVAQLVARVLPAGPDNVKSSITGQKSLANELYNLRKPELLASFTSFAGALCEVTKACGRLKVKPEASVAEAFGVVFTALRNVLIYELSSGCHPKDTETSDIPWQAAAEGGDCVLLIAALTTPDAATEAVATLPGSAVKNPPLPESVVPVGVEKFALGSAGDGTAAVCARGKPDSPGKGTPGNGDMGTLGSCGKQTAGSVGKRSPSSADERTLGSAGTQASGRAAVRGVVEGDASVISELKGEKKGTLSSSGKRLKPAPSLRLSDVVTACVERMKCLPAQAQIAFRIEVLETLSVLFFCSKRDLATPVLEQSESLSLQLAAELDMCVSCLVKADFFWSNIVPFMAKRIVVRNHEMTVLGGCLLFHRSFMTSLNDAQEHENAKQFLDSFLSVLQQYAKDPLAQIDAGPPKVDFFYHDGGIFKEVFLIELFKYVVITRKFIFGEAKDVFLGTVEKLISQATRLFAGKELVPASDAEVFARRDVYIPTVSTEFRPDGSDDSGGNDEENGGGESPASPEALKIELTRKRTLCFIAQFVGYCGKSYQDGNFNPDHHCVLRYLPSFGSKRGLGALSINLLNLQSALDCITLDESGRKNDPEEKTNTRDRLMFASDTVRRQLLICCDSVASTVLPLKSGSAAFVNPAARRLLSGRFPILSSGDMNTNRGLRTDQGTNLEEQRDFMEFLSGASRTVGIEILARFDKTCKLQAGFVLLRKNLYVSPAKRSGKDQSSSECSCVSGIVSGKGLEANRRYACSSEFCENRATRVECMKGGCPALACCQNQRLQRRKFAKTEQREMAAKGMGIVACDVIKAGDLIGEYQGEVINAQEFARRKKEYRGERHFYFMKLPPNLFIDASRFAAETRFINHSCEPNCETQKWTAGREMRVGIFAKRLIGKGEEVTFDYGTERCAQEQEVKCLCGATNCRGFLTGDAADIKARGEAHVIEEAGEILGNAERAVKIAEGKKYFSQSEEIATLVTGATLLPKSEFREGPVTVAEGGLSISDRIPRKPRFSPQVSEVEKVTPTVPNIEVRIPRKPRAAPQDPEAGKPTPAVPNPSALPPVKHASVVARPLVGSPKPEPPKKKRKGVFAMSTGTARELKKKRDIRRCGTANLAPPLRNRARPAPIERNSSDSEASLDVYSVTSPTVPVDDDFIFTEEVVLGRRAGVNDEFVEAAPVDERAEDGNHASAANGYGAPPPPAAAPLDTYGSYPNGGDTQGQPQSRTEHRHDPRDSFGMDRNFEQRALYGPGQDDVHFRNGYSNPPYQDSGRIPSGGRDMQHGGGADPRYGNPQRRSRGSNFSGPRDELREFSRPAPLHYDHRGPPTRCPPRAVPMNIDPRDAPVGHLRVSPIDPRLARHSDPRSVPYSNRRDSFGSHAAPVYYDDSVSRARHGHSDRGGLNSAHNVHDGGRGDYRDYCNGNQQYPPNGQRSHHQGNRFNSSYRHHEGGGLRRGAD